MRTLLFLAALAPAISGCALFKPSDTTTSKSETTAPAQRGPSEEIAREVSYRLHEPKQRAANGGPKGIVPCSDQDNIVSACRWTGDRHVERERELAPADSITPGVSAATPASFETDH